MFFDHRLFTAINSLAGFNPFLDFIGAFFADIFTYLLVLGVLVFILSLPSARRRLFVLLQMSLAFILGRGIFTTTIAYLVGRARPFAALGFESAFVPLTTASFPSGHAAGLFAISFILYKFNKVWGWIYFALSSLVGLARIFVGVHWPLDIVVGAFVGIAAGWIVDFFSRKSKAQL